MNPISNIISAATSCCRHTFSKQNLQSKMSKKQRKLIRHHNTTKDGVTYLLYSQQYKIRRHTNITTRRDSIYRHFAKLDVQY